LNALEADEMVAIQRHLATCPRCRSDLARYDGVVDALASAAPVVAPPPSLRNRLLASVKSSQDGAKSGASSGVLTDVPQRTEPRGVVLPRFLAGALAAAAIVLIVALGFLAVLVSDARDERDAARNAQDELTSYLSAGGQTIRLESLAAADYGDSRGYGSLITLPGKPALVVVGGCPPTTKDQWYRVWVARGEDRTPVGDLVVSDSGSGWMTVNSPEPLSSYDHIGVTLVTEEWGRSDVLVGPITSPT
jgi:hypothetical protein